MALNVLVVFYSCGGETERLALAAGVGAIQARAGIRLRRLPPGPQVEAGAMTPAERENFERMSRDYTSPRPADAEWADALIVGTSRAGRSNLEAYLDGLPASASVVGKIAAPLTADDTAQQVLRPIYAASAAAGLIVVPMPDGPFDSLDAGQAFGRHVVALASALKSTRDGDR